MYPHIKKIASHPLISGSSVLFVGSFGTNILNYLFNLGMGRLLSVNDYRIMVSLIAVISLLTIFQGALTNLFTKFAAKYTHQDPGALGMLALSGTKITLLISSIFFIVLLFLLKPISSYVHVQDSGLMLLMFASVFFSIMFSLPSGILQGTLNFLWVSASNVLGALAKVTIGIVLIMSGWGLFGAGTGVLFAFIVPYAFSVTYVFLKYRKHVSHHSELHTHFFSEFKKVSGLFLFATIGASILQSTDVIFASHYLNNTSAGQFAALSLMGKAIFYLTSPVYFAFFPVIAHKKEKKEKTIGTLFLASSIIFLCSAFFTVIYFVFPGIVLNVFFPTPPYKVLAPYLGIYSIYVMIFSFCFLLYNFFMSVGKFGVYKIIWFAAVVYLTLIFFFHSSITAFISVQMITAFLLLVLLLVYYIRNERY